MNVASVVVPAAAFLSGALLGFFFYGGLLRTVAVSLERRKTTALSALSFPARLLAAGVVFAGFARFGGFGALITAFAGFTAVQLIFLIKVKSGAPSKARPGKERVYAPDP